MNMRNPNLIASLSIFLCVLICLNLNVEKANADSPVSAGLVLHLDARDVDGQGDDFFLAILLLVQPYPAGWIFPVPAMMLTKHLLQTSHYINLLCCLKRPAHTGFCRL